MGSQKDEEEAVREIEGESVECSVFQKPRKQSASNVTERMSMGIKYPLYIETQKSSLTFLRGRGCACLLACL